MNNLYIALHKVLKRNFWTTYWCSIFLYSEDLQNLPVFQESFTIDNRLCWIKNWCATWWYSLALKSHLVVYFDTKVPHLLQSLLGFILFEPRKFTSGIYWPLYALLGKFLIICNIHNSYESLHHSSLSYCPIFHVTMTKHCLKENSHIAMQHAPTFLRVNSSNFV